MFVGDIIIMIIIALLIIVIKDNDDKNDNYNNKEINIINLVLSKLDYIPNHYKINRKDNKIFIKCHYYTKINSLLLFNGYLINDVKLNSNQDYYIKTYDYDKINTLFLYNYDPSKDLGVITFDILIDMKNKNYKIITSYFQIINCIRDDEDLYAKIIKYLETSSFYINVNNIYDENLNINSFNELFYKEFSRKDKIYRFHHMQKFNITITNDEEYLSINPILSQSGEYPIHLTELSVEFDKKPHINNHIAIKIFSGIFI
jgi:hypothetical protein